MCSKLQDAPDPTQNLTFNLSLTDSQQKSRSQVPLPYEHSGRHTFIVYAQFQARLMSGFQGGPPPPQSGQILYDPDSADDFDDDDPDEDLDI